MQHCLVVWKKYLARKVVLFTSKAHMHNFVYSMIQHTWIHILNYFIFHCDIYGSKLKLGLNLTTNITNCLYINILYVMFFITETRKVYKKKLKIKTLRDTIENHPQISKDPKMQEQHTHQWKHNKNAACLVLWKRFMHKRRDIRRKQGHNQSKMQRQKQDFGHQIKRMGLLYSKTNRVYGLNWAIARLQVGERKHNKNAACLVLWKRFMHKRREIRRKQGHNQSKMQRQKQDFGHEIKRMGLLYSKNQPGLAWKIWLRIDPQLSKDPKIHEWDNEFQRYFGRHKRREIKRKQGRNQSKMQRQKQDFGHEIKKMGFITHRYIMFSITHL
ncbi:hypothetical protein ACJX0J_038195 [Zea mays]